MDADTNQICENRIRSRMLNTTTDHVSYAVGEIEQFSYFLSKEKQIAITKLSQESEKYQLSIDGDQRAFKVYSRRRWRDL